MRSEKGAFFFIYRSIELAIDKRFYLYYIKDTMDFTKAIHIRITQPQYQKLVAQSEKMGMSISEFVRHRLFAGFIYRVYLSLRALRK